MENNKLTVMNCTKKRELKVKAEITRAAKRLLEKVGEPTVIVTRESQNIKIWTTRELVDALNFTFEDD